MMLERKDGSKYDTRDRNTGKMSNHSGFVGLYMNATLRA